MRINVIL